MPENNELKPDKTAFVAYRSARFFVLSSIFFALIYFVANPVIGRYIWYLAIGFILLQLFSYYSITVSYRKEKYIFFADKLIHRSGGIFSDNETELVVKNITHVTMRLPFIENKLFQTGTVRIQSAGSGIAEIRLRSVNNPKQHYDYIETIMKNNGFRLSKSELVQQERPAIAGIIFEVLRSLAVTGFTIFIVGANIGILSLVSGHMGLVLSGTLIILSLLVLHSILLFLDLKRRHYIVYSDTVVYKEGFLSKNYSFVPIENLSDTTITQTLVDKIFGLYDVKISCQGSSQEVHFKNMVNGPTLKSNIDTLVSKSRSLTGTTKVSEKTIEDDTDLKKMQYHKHEPLHKDTEFTREFRMDTKRTIVPMLLLLPICLILFPLMIYWIIALAFQVIKMKATRYIVKSDSMEEQYNFITSKNNEFTDDKITGIIFKESFIDKWFNTCSIHFWSIGSAQSIKFSNIKKTDGLYDSILAKTGIAHQDILYHMNSDFKFTEMLKSSLFLTIIVFLGILGFLFSALDNAFFIIPIILILIAYAAIGIYDSIYYKRSKLTFFKDYIYFTRGIFFKEFYYVLYDDIKDIKTVKYPFSALGTVEFNVAGEQIVGNGKNTTLQSNRFRINYIDDIDNKDELIDMIFYRRPDAKEISEIEMNLNSYSEKPILASKQDMANSLVGLLIVSAIFFPLLALLPITIPLTIWSVKVKSYIIQPYRIIAKSGIFYKKQVSVVFNKIDHINFGQGMLNKMFKNGNITVNTTGSSMAELTIHNIPDYKEFYDTLKKYY